MRSQSLELFRHRPVFCDGSHKGQAVALALEMDAFVVVHRMFDLCHQDLDLRIHDPARFFLCDLPLAGEVSDGDWMTCGMSLGA